MENLEELYIDHEKPDKLPPKAFDNPGNVLSQMKADQGGTHHRNEQCMQERYIRSLLLSSPHLFFKTKNSALSELYYRIHVSINLLFTTDFSYLIPYNCPTKEAFDEMDMIIGHQDTYAHPIRLVRTPVSLENNECKQF